MDHHQNQNPVTITAHPPAMVPPNTTIPAIEASFTIANYTNQLRIDFDDYTKFMAIITVYGSEDVNTPINGVLEGQISASPNAWTTTEVVHFTFAHASIKVVGEYFTHVAVMYPAGMGYVTLGSASTAAFYVIPSFDQQQYLDYQ